LKPYLHKFNINFQNRRGDTPLHTAVIQDRDCASKLQILLEAGADQSIKNNEGCTAYQEAVERKNLSALQVLAPPPPRPAVPGSWQAILGVGRDERSRSDVYSAYKQRVRETHPDKGGDAAAFRAVQSAWEMAQPSLK
jgi:ankyrin repeat protein